MEVGQAWALSIAAKGGRDGRIALFIILSMLWQSISGYSGIAAFRSVYSLSIRVPKVWRRGLSPEIRAIALGTKKALLVVGLLAGARAAAMARAPRETTTLNGVDIQT